jgi:hypothetical protein
MRFDLIERDGGKTDLIFTWAHMLMDATAAEHFLTAVSDEKIVAQGQSPAARRSEEMAGAAGADEKIRRAAR